MPIPISCMSEKLESITTQSKSVMFFNNEVFPTWGLKLSELIKFQEDIAATSLYQ